MLLFYLIISFEVSRTTSINVPSCLSKSEKNLKNLKESINLCLNNLNKCSTTGVKYRPQSNNSINTSDRIFHRFLDDKKFTYSSSQAYCELNGADLCSLKEICNDNKPFTGPYDGDNWTPIKDKINDWVQVGNDNGSATRLCKTHFQLYNRAPDWGLRTGACPPWNKTKSCDHKGHVYCCRCNQPLGMESRAIPNSRITASSFWREGFEPYEARLNNVNTSTSLGAWVGGKVPTQGIPGQFWIQIQLVPQHHVTGIITQGRPTPYEQFVISYNITYSDDGIVFTSIPKTFHGNRDMNTPVANFFPQPILTSYIRLYPLTWFDHPALRMELLGCSQ